MGRSVFVQYSSLTGFGHGSASRPRAPLNAASKGAAWPPRRRCDHREKNRRPRSPRAPGARPARRIGHEKCRAMLSLMDTNESRAFAARLKDLLRNEHHALADFLVALAEFDKRRGWIELGHSGLFPFLHRQLGLSKAASFFRMKAAEL